MKVKVIKSSGAGYWYAGKAGQVFDAEPFDSTIWDFKLIDNQNPGVSRYFDKDDVEIIQEEKTMKKGDLKTGMRVVTADGWFGICLNLEGKNVIVSEKDYLFIDTMTDDMTYKDASGCNVVEVYGLPKSYLHMINPNVKGDLLWKRDQKTEEQKQLDILLEQITDLQKQAEKLQSIVGK